MYIKRRRRKILRHLAENSLRSNITFSHINFSRRLNFWHLPKKLLPAMAVNCNLIYEKKARTWISRDNHHRKTRVFRSTHQFKSTNWPSQNFDKNVSPSTGHLSFFHFVQHCFSAPPSQTTSNNSWLPSRCNVQSCCCPGKAELIPKKGHQYSLCFQSFCFTLMLVGNKLVCKIQK